MVKHGYTSIPDLAGLESNQRLLHEKSRFEKDRAQFGPSDLCVLAGTFDAVTIMQQNSILVIYNMIVDKSIV